MHTIESNIYFSGPTPTKLSHPSSLVVFHLCLARLQGGVGMMSALRDYFFSYVCMFGVCVCVFVCQLQTFLK